LEYVEVKMRIPKPIHDFLKTLVEFTGIDLEALLEAELRKTVSVIIDELSNAPYVERKLLLARYDLGEALKDC